MRIVSPEKHSIRKIQNSGAKFKPDDRQLKDFRLKSNPCPFGEQIDAMLRDTIVFGVSKKQSERKATQRT